ncbi:MAG: hypothetical protein J1F63_09205 [Oscillospiraceae bacterium]|nr:hypothetical protein [Oscillospiraceae bacterium]
MRNGFLYKTTALIIALMFLLTGCGNPAKKAEEAVNSAFAALQKADFEELGKYVTNAEPFGGDTMGLVDDVDALGDAMYGRMEHKITSSELQKDGSVTVTADITNVDMSKAFDSWYTAIFAFMTSEEAKSLNQEELIARSSEMLFNTIKTAEDTITTTVDITVSKNEKGKWQLEVDNDLIDAASGGIVSVLGNNNQ